MGTSADANVKNEMSVSGIFSSRCKDREVMETIMHLRACGQKSATGEDNEPENPRYSAHNDISLALLFADVFGRVLRYNPTAKSFYHFDGVSWNKDEEGMIAEALAKKLSDAMYLASYYSQNEAVMRFYSKLGSRRTRSTMITDSRDFNLVSYEDFDRDPNLLNCKNGILDLQTFELRPHDPDYLLSKCTGCDYDPDARSSAWDNFISEIMQGNDAKIDYLQRIMGYSLLGSNPEELFFIFLGTSTRNGKSTLLETVGAALGTYSAASNPDTIAAKNKDGSAPSSDLARLNGCRFLRMSEPRKGMILNVELLKSMTGGDRITARFLHENDQEFTPVFKLILNANHLPIVNDRTLFASDRVAVLTFDRHFEKAERDLTLKTKLSSKKNLSAVLNWCIEGLRKYREYGLIQPMEVQEATEAYAFKSDKIGNFISEVLIRDSRSNISAGAAYNLYKDWCLSAGYGSESKGNFFTELKTRGLWKASGTIGGITVRNVIGGYRKRTEKDDDQDDEEFNGSEELEIDLDEIFRVDE